MQVVVAGSHGFIGSRLVPHLRAGGHRVTVLVRGEAKGADQIAWDPVAGRLDPAALAGADAVINLAGANPGSRPLTEARKREVLSSRLLTTRLLARTLAELDEDEPIGSTFFANGVRQWEAATAPAADDGVRVVHLRTGIVLGQGGGALGPLLPLIKAGVGGRLGSGRQFWPWITLLDEVRAIEHLLTADVQGPVNLVTAPARNAEVVAALAGAFHRPAAIPVPSFALRLVLRDFSSEVLGSIRAVPAVLDASGFVPVHGDLATAAAWVAAS